MTLNDSTTHVVLPKWCWDKANNKQELKDNISFYMKIYPGYKIVEIHKYYAICQRN